MVDKNLKIKISEMIKRLGVPTNLKGYDYLRDAIELVIKDKTYLYDTVNSLYPEIAKKYIASSPNNIERNIRTAIEAAWERGNPKIWDEVFINQLKKRPVNTEFVACVADYIKLKAEKVIK